MDEIIDEIDWDSIRVSPFQPRRVFSEEELKELALSIQAIGLIHPPVVRKIQSKNRILYYELIAGERRWRAAKLAGQNKIKVIVRESTDQEAAKATLIENIQRVDLNPIETALAFKRLIEVFRMKQEDVAEKVGKKRSTVANYLRLLSLPADMQQRLSLGEITMGHAKALLSLESHDLQKKLSSLITEKQMTVRDAEKESARLSQKKKKRNEKDADLEILEKKLEEHFGASISIEPIGKQSGRIHISYQSFDDLERILNLAAPGILSQ